MPKKQTQQEFIEKSIKIFGDMIDYSKVKYIDARVLVILICKKHGEFKIKPKDHLCYRRACSICSGFRHNLESFLKAAKTTHGDRFNYNKVIFCGVKTKVIIECRIHGEFLQTPDKHLNKQGCPKCKKAAIKDLEYVISYGKAIHNNLYDYSEVVYNGMGAKIKIICKNHGPFYQTPTNHIVCKHKCPKCAIEQNSISKDNFINRAGSKHNNIYDYSEIEYINSRIKIKIICKKHGDFYQSPLSHLSGSKCPYCRGSISQKETQWLDYLKIDRVNRNKIIKCGKKRYRVDAYDPITNTIYEFYGDYWHGNPKLYNKSFINKHNKIKFSTLYKDTIKRENHIKKSGHNIVIIWEKDWDSLYKEIKNRK